MIDRIHSIVQELRYEYGPHPDDLLGFCKRNAKAISKTLVDVNEVADDQIFIIKGGLNIPGEPAPESLREAQQAGLVHYWTVVENNPDIHCDLASEDPDCFPPGSQPVIGTKPEPYIEFERVLYANFNNQTVK